MITRQNHYLKAGAVVLGLALATVACDSGEKKPEAAAKAGADTPAKAEKADNKTAEKSDKAGGAAAGELGHNEILKQGSALEGKEVTVKAISWGTSKMAGGKKRLNLGPAKLEGLRQAHLVADFEKDDASVDKVNKDDEVKMKCTVGKKAYGARQLEKCKIL